MTDLTQTIIPKSDQLNADDLIGRDSLTIRVTKVVVRKGDQPVIISCEGDGGKPYLPCKSMRRLLVAVWSGDGDAYVGRSMTLYRDPDVEWGGVPVGGLRISHMSHLEKPVTISLTEKRGIKKPHTVKPLAQTPTGGTTAPNPEAVAKYRERLRAQPPEEFDAAWAKTPAQIQGALAQEFGR